MTNATIAEPVRLLPGTPVPDLDVPLARGGRWRLADQKPDAFTLVVVFRGVHCSFCKPEVEKLQAMAQAFADIGVSVLAVSMDGLDRAARAVDDWAIPDLALAYGLSERQARAWGLYISRRIKDVEPEVFAEPGAFLVRPDGTLFAEFQSTVPWLRLDFDVLLRGVQIAMQRGTPPRGGA